MRERSKEAGLGAEAIAMLERQIREGDRRMVLLARILLCRGRGLSRGQTAGILGCSLKTVSKWWTWYGRHGLEGLREKVGMGPSERSAVKRAEPAKSELPSKRSANIRDIAKRVGVSAMTVSRALNHHPYVRDAVRSRVLKEAEALQYRANPDMKKLMVSLRKSRSESRSTICALQPEDWINGGPFYFEEVMRGAREKAEALGFNWTVFPLDNLVRNQRVSLRTLYNRGVDGILLGPAKPGMYDALLAEDSLWYRFSVVANSAAIGLPGMARIRPDYFNNMMQTCSRLWEQGVRRFALFLPETLNPYSHENYLGAYLAFMRKAQQPGLQPFFYGRATPREAVRKWDAAERPEVLIFANEVEFHWVVRNHFKKQFPPGRAAILLRQSTEYQGIDENPHQVGSTSVSELTDQIVHYERGFTTRLSVRLVEGTWKAIGTA